MAAHPHAPRRVCIIQPVMKGYRLPFFQQLAARLQQEGTTLQVVYSRPWAEHADRGDNVALPPPLGHEVGHWRPLGRLLLQPVLRPWLRADLVVVEHANKNLLNLPLLLLSRLGLKRVAFWGHGRDSSADPNAAGERFKRLSLHGVDWWFAYTAGAARYVAGQGFDSRRVTVVENAVDTQALRSQLDAITADAVAAAQHRLGLQPGDQVAVFCASLYASKRLDVLFDAADLLHRQLPRFRLIVIGGGPLTAQVQAWCAPRPWARAVGPLFGPDKALHLHLAQLWLNPGVLGLGILDGFVAGLPMVTAEQPGHGPEIEYLDHDRNGLLLQPQAEPYAAGVAALLTDPPRLARLQAAALADGQRYSIETMAHNFATGIHACLALPPR